MRRGSGQRRRAAVAPVDRSEVATEAVIGPGRSRSFMVVWAVVWSVAVAVLFIAVTALTVGLWFTDPDYSETTPVSDLSFFVLGAIIGVGFLSQLRTPERRIAGVQQAAIGVLSLAVAGTAGDRIEPLVGSLILLGAVAVMWSLHPARRELFRPGGRVSVPVLVMSGVAVVPAALYAAKMLRLALDSGPSCFLGQCVGGDRYAEMGAAAVAVVLVAVLSGLRTPGWRLALWSAGMGAVVMGSASLWLSDVPGSLGASWGAAAVLWGLLIIAIGEAAPTQIEPHTTRGPGQPGLPTREGTNMNVLVTYATRHGSTKEIAERIAAGLRTAGFSAEARSVTEVRDLDRYHAFVIGSAVYMFHWLREATRFVKRHRVVLAERPVWLFSSGPLGSDLVDEDGQDILEASRPKEFDELADLVTPLGEKVFFGAWDPETPVVGMAERLVRLMPAAKDSTPAGDFRDWVAIDAWAAEIATQLQSTKTDHHSNETVWPWFSNVAPVSWLVQRNVDEGREQLNYSEWNRPQEGEASAETVREGSMPPRSYLLTHPEARLSNAEKAALADGLAATFCGESDAGGEEGEAEEDD